MIHSREHRKCDEPREAVEPMFCRRQNSRRPTRRRVICGSYTAARSARCSGRRTARAAEGKNLSRRRVHFGDMDGRNGLSSIATPLLCLNVANSMSDTEIDFVKTSINEMVFVTTETLFVTTATNNQQLRVAY